MESSRCCTRRIGWDSSNRPESEKWTSNSLAPTICVIGPALRTSTAKPADFTVGCALARHSLNLPGKTPNAFWRPVTLASHARIGFAASATRCSPGEPTFGTRATMGCGGLEKSARVRRRMEYTWSDFRRPGADQASSPSGALHDLNGGRMKYLVPPDPRSQRIPSGDPT